MNPARNEERSSGVYLVTLYFVVTGFLESIQRFREWGSVVVWNPLAEHSLWHLVANTLMYLAVAYLVWERTWFGRMAALVFGYLTLATYLGAALVYLNYRPEGVSPSFSLLGLFHVAALVPILVYLQPARARRQFQVSLLDILLPPE